MGGSVRLLTANLWNGRADAKGFAELVQRLEADVVAVQEITPEQARELERVLPHGRVEPACDHSGMGFALRHPGELDRLPLPDRPARIARLDPSAWPALPGPLEILNVHLTAPHLWPPWRSLALRRHQVRALAAYLETAPEVSRALAGDLNATPLWPAYRRLARRLADAAHVAGGARGRTWGPGARGPRLLRIDHVLIGRLEVERIEVVAVPGSDHSAVVADLAPEGRVQPGSA